MQEVSERDDHPLATALDPNNVLPRAISRWAHEDPDRPFLTEAETGASATYGEFSDLTRRWARVLLDQGVSQGDRVVSLLPSSIDAHAVWIAASLIGAIEVPINPALTGEFLRHVLADSGAELCVVRLNQTSIVEGSGVANLRAFVAADNRSSTSEARPFEPRDLPAPDDVSCVIYTSGTTGPAKGVVIRWAQMSATIGRMPRSWFTEDDAVYSPWPMFHVTGRSPMFAMAQVGGRVVVREKFSAPDFWNDINKHRCTSTTCGAVTALILAAPERADDQDNPLRLVFFGKVGQLGVQFLERFGASGVSCYGSTEVGFPVVNRAIDRDSYEVAGWLRRGYDARVIDEHGTEVASGEVGELLVRPPDRRMIMREYLNHPERTEAAVVDGWYHTGDAVRIRPDGGVIFIDRMRDTIRRFGENISSAWLESVVVTDPELLECAAIGVASTVAGQEIHLLVVPSVRSATKPAELAARLRETLPKHMNPSYITVVDELPKTPNGKVRKVGLADEFDIENAWKAPR
jgi:crotonobetaine/carnitine-CoA ligase